MSLVVVHAPSLKIAREGGEFDLTVEAEYGDSVVEGRLYTAAHHQRSGPYVGRHLAEGGRPSPCNDPGIPTLQGGRVLVSHIDLDTVGGVLRAHPDYRDLFVDGFWNLAEFVDVNGAHKIAGAMAADADLKRLYAWWAYAKKMPRLSRDREEEITQVIVDAGEALRLVLADDTEMNLAGELFREKEARFNEATFVRQDGPVIVRVGADFCNHLYATPSGVAARAVVALNTRLHSVTVSLADPDQESFSCVEIVQKLWGPEAGGHKGIAGGPRGTPFNSQHLEEVVAELLLRFGV
jgi:hypothetical protein